jgi:NAD(P)-dependent dehydrogenase (short-subunit alcohol dehydrogenase family)
LDNKNVLITGASSGVGLSIANQCAERGAHLVLLARRLDKLEEIQKEIQKQYSVSVHVYKLDVSDTDEIKRVFTQIIAEIGRIDVLVNNAGITGWTPLFETTEEQWDQVIETNLKGTFFCSLEAARLMRETLLLSGRLR